MTTYLFPGQGSQAKGMGENLFKKFPELTKKANEVLGYSIEDLCINDPQQQLNLTQFTQPAIYVINALSYYDKLIEQKRLPDFLVGHSLGEYNALLAAEVYDFETGLKLVKKRGELMSQASNGGMLAVIGLKPDIIYDCLVKHGLIDVTIANYNSYTQSVVSGLKYDIERALPLLNQAGATMVIPLNVSGAFHSKYMQAAQIQFEFFLKGFEFSAPSIPVISNVNAKPYPSFDISDHLSQQITNSVRWTDSMNYLLEKGEGEFIEVGPGNTLTGLIRRIKNGQ